MTLKQNSNRPCSFSKKTGDLATVSLENCRTVNSDWCKTIYLPKVIDGLRINNPICRIIWHHDNASSHTTNQTNKFLKEKSVDLVTFFRQKRLSKSMKTFFQGHQGGRQVSGWAGAVTSVPPVATLLPVVPRPGRKFRVQLPLSIQIMSDVTEYRFSAGLQGMNYVI
ncbi:hypothetical protein EVAR_21732_1 [Eumeta japonica]|uniref:Mariner Mos1 transposase n=1 Tax=Eumeta variegata TaxID=151549 RepID=A0A4C1W4Z2_EUMVA|nr:hypothetical protein EVAR_21732_1 [Eumeta japonica]